MLKIGKGNKVLELAKRKGVVQAADVVAEGVPREYLSRLTRQGLLERIGRGLYCLPERDLGEHQVLIEVSRRVPKGVFCLLSALRFHELSTQSPFEVWIAVESKSWLPKIEYPPVRFVYFSKSALAAGVHTHLLEGVPVKVFNSAKTVVDCFKYRNKIGLDVALEALKEGWSKKIFTMDELTRYAKICRVQNVIRPYLEVLV